MAKPYVPPRRKPKSDDEYFEILTQGVFFCGFSWDLVRKKWPAFRRAFFDFQIPAVANFSKLDIERLLDDPSIIRNRRKIEATIHNAKAFIEIIDEFGSVHSYLRHFKPWHYGTVVKDMMRRFRHVGPTACFYFLYSVGEKVPSWQERKKLD